ncbi:hypothetical protein LTR66_000612 [Elasticomyces elasticus]|nr:hypothetical protein LTR66_000612 [Elasticomyces elasticus]
MDSPTNEHETKKRKTNTSATSRPVVAKTARVTTARARRTTAVRTRSWGPGKVTERPNPHTPAVPKAIRRKSSSSKSSVKRAKPVAPSKTTVATYDPEDKEWCSSFSRNKDSLHVGDVILAIDVMPVCDANMRKRDLNRVRTKRYGDLCAKCRPYVVITKERGHCQISPTTTCSGRGIGHLPVEIEAEYAQIEAHGDHRVGTGVQCYGETAPLVVTADGWRPGPMAVVHFTRLRDYDYAAPIKRIGKLTEQSTASLLDMVKSRFAERLALARSSLEKTEIVPGHGDQSAHLSIR